MRIDAHQHFWRYTPEEYGWIDDRMAAIRRDFFPPDLEKEMASCGVGGAVSVQARQTLEETSWLLDLAGRHETIRAVVGWVPLADPAAKELLQRFAADPKFRGVRHVVQGEPDGFMERDDFNAGVRLLRPLDLVYDILVFERQLPEAIRFVDRHPGQVFVLDHIAKPRIRDGLLEPWRQNIRELALRENVFCKVSGMVTEADFLSWDERQLRPYWDTVLAAFTPRRLMFGSDWPVCLTACGYKRWHEVVSGWITPLSRAERERILGGTALAAYRPPDVTG